MTSKQNATTGKIDRAERLKRGQEWFEHVMTIPAPPPDSPYTREGISNFVFAEMWSRPLLDVKTRRWITLACVGAADTDVPITSHVYAALKSGDITYEEMQEFVLHFAVYSGWPKASRMEQAVREAWQQVQDTGGPNPRREPPEPG